MTFFALLLFSQVTGDHINWTVPPVTISSSSLAASDPQVAIDASGNAAAIWVENGLIKASLKPASGSWSTGTTISNSGASSPSLVSDTSGNLTAVWLESGVVKAASMPSGGSWSALTSLSLSNASSPNIAVDSAGDVVAAWARLGNIESSTKLSGGSWQTRQTITSSSATSPRVAVGGTGSGRTAFIVWSGVSSSTNVVFASNKPITGNWSAQTTISNTAHNAGFATVAADASANAVAVWYAYDVASSNYSNVNVQSTYKPFDKSWRAPNVLSASGIRNPATLGASVAFDAIGNAVAVWNTSYDDITYNVESAVLPLRGQWTNATTLVNSNLFASQASMAVSSLGDAITVYMFYNGAYLLIQSSESNFSGFINNVWAVPTTLSVGTNQGFPKIAATLTGNTINAVSVWLTTNGTVNTISATTGTRSVVLPPTSLAVSQSSNSFGGVFTEYQNTVSWTASTAPNVVGYIIFRNGTPIAEVGADEVEFVDRNRVQSASVTYGVAAIDNQGSQSTIPTVSL